MTAKYWFSALILGLTFTSAAPAQDMDPYSGDHWAVVTEQVADGVYLISRPPSWLVPVQTNVTVIINEEDVVVVDGAGLPRHAENVIAEIRKLTDKPVSTIVNTHWHQDHNWGNHIYKREYPGVEVIAHANTRAHLVTSTALDSVNSPEYPGRIKERLENLRQSALEEGQPPEVKAWMDDVVEMTDERTLETRRAQKSLADVTIDAGTLTLYRPNRRIEIKYFGRANTEGDLIIWLPDQKVAISGDVVVRPTPYGFGSHPREWVEVLGQIKALDYDILIPGHGDIQRDTQYIDLLAELLTAVADRTEAAVAAGAESLDEAREQVDLSDFDDRMAGDDPLLRYLFNLWFKQPIVGGAYGDATAEDGAEGGMD